MCGRTACTLDPDDLCKASHYIDRHGNKRRPAWRDDLSTGKYYPSYNMGPTKHVPVMMSQQHFDSEAELDDRMIVPASWGFVTNFGSESQRIINARTETVLEKPTFKTPLLSGKRCVVLAEGYYEWYRSDVKNKQPYFIHFPQPKGIELHDTSWKSGENGNEEWNGPRLLTIAGIFNTMKSLNGEQLGFVVLTVHASESVSHIHDRMPALLDGETAVHEWLNYGKIKADQAVGMLKPSNNIEAYKVSSFVNNVRNNGPECIQPLKPSVEKKTASQAFMQNWLKRSSTQDGKDAKKLKDDK